MASPSGSQRNACATVDRPMDATVSLADIQDLFSSGVTPLLDGLQRVEEMVEGLRRRMDHTAKGHRSGGFHRQTSPQSCDSAIRSNEFKSDRQISEESCEVLGINVEEVAFNDALDSIRCQGSKADDRQLFEESCELMGINAEEVAFNDALKFIISPDPKAESISEPQIQDLEEIQVQVEDDLQSSKDGQSSMTDDTGETPPSHPCSPRSVDSKSQRSLNSRAFRRASTASALQETGASEREHRMAVQREMAKFHGAHDKQGRVVAMAVRVSSWWHSIKEPTRSGRLFHITEARWFENLCMFQILINSLFVAYATDWEMFSESDQKPESFFRIEAFFNAFFVLELSLRLIVHRHYYFVNKEGSWNTFDFVLVVFAVADQVLTVAMPDGGGAGNVGFVRILRFMRLAKIFRAFRTVKFFTELSNLAESFKKSLFTLFWSIVLMVLTTFVFSLVFLQALADYVKRETTDAQTAAGIHQYFGSLGKTMLSLYMSVTGGDDWSLYFNIVSLAGPFYAAVFLLFTFFFIFALFNILTGMLVEKAVSASKPDRNDVILQKRKQHREDRDELMRMCKILDQDGDGIISREEFEDMFANSVFASYMSALGMEVTDTHLFFSTIVGSSDCDELRVEDFVDACSHMRGGATNVDMKGVSFQTSSFLSDMQSVVSKNSDALERIDAISAQLATALGKVSRDSRIDALSSQLVTALGNLSTGSQILQKQQFARRSSL